eukprot:4794901-Prymnesium_polylepis.1
MCIRDRAHTHPQKGFGGADALREVESRWAAGGGLAEGRSARARRAAGAHTRPRAGWRPHVTLRRP